MMLKRKILLFGATGEIGGRVARYAADEGHEVVAVSRGKRTIRTPLDGVKVLQGDKYDREFLKTLVPFEPDVLIDTTANETGARNYAEIFPFVRSVFFVSSTGVYAPIRYFPAAEDHPWQRDTGVNFPHQVKKDLCFLEMFREQGFPVTLFRPSNIFGPGSVPLDLWGGRDPEFFRALKENRPVAVPACFENILIQSCVNSDIAKCIVLALRKPDEVKGEIFNISSERAITLGLYLETVMDYFGSRSEIRRVPVEELMTLYPGKIDRADLDFFLCHMSIDISKAVRVLGYKPEWTVQTGLIETLRTCEEQGLF